jgi:WD repeat-containing protein 48
MSYGKREIEDVESEVNTVETVAPWCSINTKTGCLTVVLEEHNCFDAEMYVDELDIEEDVEFKEDQRSMFAKFIPAVFFFLEFPAVNLGKWVLRYLFDNLIAEEIRRDENFRRALFYTKNPHLIPNGAAPRSTPGSIQIPATHVTSWLDTTSAPTSASTLKPSNGLHYPQTPGMAIGFATPAVFSKLNPTSSPQIHQNGDASPTAPSSARTSSERPSNDYFSRPLLPNNPAVSPHGTAASPSTTAPNGRLSHENAQNTSPMPPTPGAEAAATASPEKTSIFGKKFKGMSLIPKSLKKGDKTAKTPTPDDQPSDTDSRTSQTDERLNEDSLLGTILRIRHGYEIQSKSLTSEKENGLNIQATGLNKDLPPKPQAMQNTTYTPSLSNDTPVLKLPPHTIILIQEESSDSGGVADLYEGTVGTVARDADTIERVGPSWLADVILRNVIPQKELVKVSFVLEPWQNTLPPVSAEGNTRLNANRMLRGRKILSYVADRIEPASDRPDASVMKPEDYLELHCHDQVRSISSLGFWRLFLLIFFLGDSPNHDIEYHPNTRLAITRRCDPVL